MYFQDLFLKIDKEDDGAIYLNEIVLYLRALNEDIDKNLQVKIYFSLKFHFLMFSFIEVKVLLDQYDTNGQDEIGFPQFIVSNSVKINV